MTTAEDRRLEALGPPAGPAATAGEEDRSWLHLSPFTPAARLVNGRLVQPASRLDGADVRSFGRGEGERPQGYGTTAAEERSPYAALGGQRFVEGLVVRFPAGRRAVGPLLLFHDTAPAEGDAGASTSVYARTLVLVEEGAEADLLEVHRAHEGGPAIVQATTEVRVARGGRLRHVRLQLQEDGALHAGATAAVVERDAAYHLVAVTHGGEVDRHDVHIDLVGEGAEASLSGLYALRDLARSDLRVQVEHRVPHGTSRQIVRGIVGERARGAFTGRVVVHPGADKTSGTQAHHALLLSREARVEGRPELEIYADDVQCAHGATVGQLDEDALFYLRARGIGEEEARLLLVQAFAHDVLAALGHDALRHDVQRLLEARLAGREPEPVGA